MDANIRWALTEKVGLMLRVNNVLDNDDYVIAQQDQDLWILGEPRTFEASLDFRF
jgi:outer membrane receptor for ferric coprogen and ferric-rhodotorulic acid